jgi:hypothetical protein
MSTSSSAWPTPALVSAPARAAHAAQLVRVPTLEIGRALLTSALSPGWKRWVVRDENTLREVDAPVLAALLAQCDALGLYTSPLRGRTTRAALDVAVWQCVRATWESWPAVQRRPPARTAPLVTLPLSP